MKIEHFHFVFCVLFERYSLREKWSYLELFRSAFSVIRTLLRENADQNNSEYGHFLRSDCQQCAFGWET